MEWLSSLIDWVINSIGMYGIWAIVFAESGLFFGFFLPGDSLLIASGIFAASGRFDITILTTGIVIAAILGDQVGYWTGKIFGKSIFKENRKWLNHNHLASARKFFEKHGPIAIVLARFTPAVRTFTPIVAGAVGMNYRTFVIFNVIGALIWGAGLTLFAYFAGLSLGQENVKKWEIYILGAVLLVSLIPITKEIIEHRKTKKAQQTTQHVSEESAHSSTAQ